MKKFTLIACIVAIALTSCSKKDDPKPSAAPTTITVTDTIFPQELKGTWFCYKVEQYSNNILTSSTPHNDWIYTFTNNNFIQNHGGTSTTYPITYYMEFIGGGIDILFGFTPTSYYVSNTKDGQEYEIIKTPGHGTYEVWYLKK